MEKPKTDVHCSYQDGMIIPKPICLRQGAMSYLRIVKIKMAMTQLIGFTLLEKSLLK